MIDAHHHLWQYEPGAYPWITSGMRVLQRDFLVPDLRPHLAAGRISGTVAVQARSTIEETLWLLEAASAHPEILGVVGWAPLDDSRAAAILERLAADRRLRGVRHVLQDEPDDDYMLRKEFNRSVAALPGLGLTYDILIYERHLPQTLAFVDRHPNLVFVLDHLGKPRIRERRLSPWRERMRELARREHVFCKISGLATEADWERWTGADLQPYIDVVLECFGPRRLMFGSDWPVVLLAAGYDRWVRTFGRAIAALSANERAWIAGRTAREAYRLG